MYELSHSPFKKKETLFTQLTFDNLLGAGVVDLYLAGVGGEHLVKHIGLPL